MTGWVNKITSCFIAITAQPKFPLFYHSLAFSNIAVDFVKRFLINDGVDKIGKIFYCSHLKAISPLLLV